jgi:hypothetical protein
MAYEELHPWDVLSNGAHLVNEVAAEDESSASGVIDGVYIFRRGVALVQGCLYEARLPHCRKALECLVAIMMKRGYDVPHPEAQPTKPMGQAVDPAIDLPICKTPSLKNNALPVWISLNRPC